MIAPRSRFPRHASAAGIGLAVPRPARAVSGKAELGLLAALLLFGGLVTMIIRSVIGSHQDQPPPAAELAKPVNTTPSHPPRMAEAPPQPLLHTSKPAVTIIADEKSQAALARLRDIVKPAEGNQANDKKTPTEAPPKQASSSAPASDFAPLQTDSPEVREAAELLKKFRAAKSEAEKLPLVFQPGQAGPRLREQERLRPTAVPGPEHLASAADIDFGGTRVLSLICLVGGRPGEMMSVNFHRTAGGLRLDWESLVGYCEKPMPEFRAARETKPTILRVLAEPDDYYNFEFDDSAQYLSLRLHSPDREDYLHGFLQRQSADTTRLINALSLAMAAPHSGLNGAPGREASRLAITVELAFPPDAKSDRCVRISRLVSIGWLAEPVREEKTTAHASDNPAAR